MRHTFRAGFAPGGPAPVFRRVRAGSDRLLIARASCSTNDREAPDLDRISVRGRRLSVGGPEWEVRGRFRGE
jgi:hypothetical protein